MSKQRDWQSILVRLAVALAALLVVLASLALLYILIQVLQRFGGILVLFVLGAIVAYMLSPAADRLAGMLHKRWAGTALVYLGLVVLLLTLGVLLFQPLISQSSGLVNALNHPSSSSLRLLRHVGTEADQIEHEVQAEKTIVQAGGTLRQGRTRQVQASIAAVQADITALGVPAVSPPARRAETPRKPAAQVQLRIPPSYLRPLQAAALALRTDYDRAVQHPAAPALASLTRAVSDVQTLSRAAAALDHTVSTTPVILLDAQIWADQHHIGVNVQQSAGQIIKKASDQASSLLNNSAVILSQTATVLLDVSLVLIISVYLVIDGGHMVEESVALVPQAYHHQAVSFINSVDSILGGYIRGQIMLALLASVLSGIGAAILGVPYPLVIAVGTFFLQLIPVIGPTLVYIPPMIIAALFTSMPTPAVFLVYLILMEQLVTNVIGPRVNSQSVGIHPLEAMAAALFGYPIGGFLGSFLAVPIVGLCHVIARQAYASWQARKPAADSAADGGAPAENGTSRPGHDPAIGSASVNVQGRKAL